jgi:hypothetical protein
MLYDFAGYLLDNTKTIKALTQYFSSLSISDYDISGISTLLLTLSKNSPQVRLFVYFTVFRYNQ